jgi:hypothetical protein
MIMSIRVRTSLSFLSALVLAAPLAAQQASDPLQQARQRREVEAQRLEREIRDGRDAAYRVVRIDSEAAIKRIQALLELLEVDDALPAARRDQLTRTLKRDITLLKGVVTDRRAAASEAAARAGREEVRRTEEARRPGDTRSAFDAARGRVESMGSRAAEARDIRIQVADRFSGVLKQVDLSAKLPADDIEFPPDWVEKSKKRSPEQKLTPKEKELLGALKKPITLEFNGDTFSSVIEYLQKITGQTILLDKPGLDEANVTNETPITLRLPKVATRTALKRMLKDLNLTYVVKEECIYITTPARAKEFMVTRAYYIGDLLGVADIRFGPAITQLQMIQSVGSIINTIQTQIDPDSWQANNGNGTVVFDPITMSLVIKASAEIHYMLGGGH